MILEIINKDYEALMGQLQFVLIAWAIVIISVGIDLHFGIRKSKEIGMFTHSYGLRQTSKKVVQYLSFMAFMLFFDVLNVFWIYIPSLQKVPLATLFGAIILVYTEAKSVREKATDKFKKALRTNPAELIKFAEQNIDLLNSLVDRKKDKEEK